MSRSLDNLTPEVKELCQKFLQGCSEIGHPMLVVQTFRSFEEQEALYAKGRFRPGPVVTHARAGYSWHNFRRAFDVCFLRGTDITWNGPWADIAQIGREIGLTWGGDWDQGKQDRPHFEYHPGLTLEMVRAQSMIPKVKDYLA